MEKSQIIILDETDSTNKYAEKLALNEWEGLVVAKRQNAGRGRLDRSFISRPGGLYMSVVSGINESPTDLLHYPLLTAIAVSDFLNDLYSIDTLIKWPNDIYYKDKKIVGILVQMYPKRNKTFLVTGVGINLANGISSDIPYAADLFELTGQRFEAGDIAADLADRINDYYSRGQTDKLAFLEKIESRCLTIGRHVRAESAGISGIAAGIGCNGELIVETDLGGRASIDFGDVIC
ncbi:MAG: biotin--[Lachnospiraceae bacterium]|nr:biotin--[acetyl-CoA-carboxylase] ligase [Lachnospiraceae bacterium]